MPEAPRASLAALMSIDRLVHEPARLSLLSVLAVVRQADFVFLRRETGLTAGNVSSHLGKLASAGYVEIDKRFSGNRPQTMVRISRAGRLALRRYLEAMRAVVDGLEQ